MSIVKKVIMFELNELIPKSKFYAAQLETAKTETKRKMMRKRLKQNNEKIADLIIALEKLEKKENNNVEDGIEGRAEAESSAEESIS